MYIFDAESANEVKAEERVYEAWQLKEKNRILAMSNVQKKQTMWNILFPQVEHSEDYLNGLVF